MKIQKYQQLIVISSLTILLIVYIQFKKTAQARLAQQSESYYYDSQTNKTLPFASAQTSLQATQEIQQENTAPETVNDTTPRQLHTSDETNALDAATKELKNTRTITIVNGITKKDVAYKKMGTHHPEFETKINGIIVQPAESITIDTDADHIDVTYSYTFKSFGRIIKQDTKTVFCPLLADNKNVILGFSWHKTPHIFLLPQC